jgi:hypothetical protein
MANREYIDALVQFGRLTPSNVGQLEQDLICVRAKIRAQGGQQVASVTIPGQTTSWVTTMTLQEEMICLAQAISQLTNAVRIVRRTVNRNFV